MITIVEFDFATKQERTIDASEIRRTSSNHVYWWIDMDGADPAACEALLKTLGVGPLALSEILGPDREGRYDVYEECLHFAVSEVKYADKTLQSSHVDIVLGLDYLVTFHRRDAEFIKQMRRTYREDFIKFSKTPGFLLYEIGDHLIDGYRKTLQVFSEAVEQIQLQLFGEVNDDIFKQVSDLTSDILMFRKIIMAARELMHELATRKSPFINEHTQPFLQNMAGTLERLSGDLGTERDVLNNTLSLYMGMVSHRTNKVISRLTVISMIFLPLSFLCSVYGSNFKNIPGTDWKYGYLTFCIVMLLIAAALLRLMRKQKWL